MCRYAEYTHKGELVERKSATELFAAMGNMAPLLVSWSDLQRQLAESLPEGVLEAQACFQGYTEEEGGVQVGGLSDGWVGVLCLYWCGKGWRRRGGCRQEQLELTETNRCGALHVLLPATYNNCFAAA